MIRPNHPPSPFPLLVSHVADSSHTNNDTMENQLRFSHNSRLAPARTTSPQVLPLNGKSSTSSLPGSALLKYRLQELRNELVHHLDTIQQIKTQIGHISTTMQVLAPLEQLEEQEFRRRQMRLRSTKKQAASEGDPSAQEASQTSASKKTVVVGRVKKVQQQAPSSLDSPTSIAMTSVPQRPSDDDIEDENVATTENTEIEPSDAALMMMMNAYPQYYSTQSNNGSATEASRASKRQRDEEEEIEGETSTKQLQQDGEETADTEEQRAPQRRRRKMQKKDDDRIESNNPEGVEDAVEVEKNHNRVASHSSSPDSNPFGALIDAVDNEVTSGSDAPIIPRQPPRTPITPSLTVTPTPNLARLPLYRNESRGHPVGSPLQVLPSTLNRSPVGTTYSPIQQPMITLDPPVQPSKSMCVMCKRANVNLKKGYSSRNYTEDYQAVFPTFKGEIGLVCGSCYMICYSYRSKKGKPSSTSPRTLHRLPNSVSHEHKNLGEVYSTPETVHRIISTEEGQPLSPPPTELTPQVQIETQPAKASTSPKKTPASATTRTTGRRKRKPSEKRASLYDSDSDGI